MDVGLLVCLVSEDSHIPTLWLQGAGPRVELSALPHD